jgi:hypothetical protein
VGLSRPGQRGEPRPLAGHPGRVHYRPGRAGHPGLPAAWNPDSARQTHIDEVIRRHLGGDLAGAFGPYQATWVHPPAPPVLARFDGYDLPATRSTWPPWPAGGSGSRTCKTRNRTCSSRPAPGAARPPPRPSRPRTAGPTAGWSTSSTPNAGPTSAGKPGRTCWSTRPASGCTPSRNTEEVPDLGKPVPRAALSCCNTRGATRSVTGVSGAGPTKLSVRLSRPLGLAESEVPR